VAEGRDELGMGGQGNASEDAVHNLGEGVRTEVYRMERTVAHVAVGSGLAAEVHIALVASAATPEPIASPLSGGTRIDPARSP